MDIAEFQNARLNEREQLARAATPGPWSPEKPFLSDVVTSALLGRVADCAVGTEYRAQSLEDARHIAYHDPAFALAEVAAMRERLRMYTEQRITLRDMHANPDQYSHDQQVAAAVSTGVLETVVRLDVAGYTDHPDYEPAWRVA